MTVVVRSSSLLFFLVSILLELPVHRRNRRDGDGQAAVAGKPVYDPDRERSPTVARTGRPGASRDCYTALTKAL
jgi:hypothetical protein